MGPNDGKSFMHPDATPTNNNNNNSSSSSSNGLPPLSSSGTRIVALSNLSMSEANHQNTSIVINGSTTPTSIISQNNSKKQTSSSGIKQIAKNDISAPTNFRHVVKGLDDYVQQQPPLPHNKNTPSPPNSIHGNSGSKVSARIVNNMSAPLPAPPPPRATRADESIQFFVSTNPASSFTIDVYRMGFYGGTGSAQASFIFTLTSRKAWTSLLIPN